MSSVKLDIHGQSTPRKWCGSTPRHSNFQSIHLARSFTGRTSPPTNPAPTDAPILYCPTARKNSWTGLQQLDESKKGEERV
ncbi:hypothetical protein AVEN_220819-1 [Araneus ventricosus]|uniref:Uncharacterized protein n=1 Tax=Araneus ventricosus TaxID=182803 RepID=A0A4Y2FQH7_ARAVE|nr:hypothetical protein AVEN_220819-1 [Araneus ventricosus]